ncbi:MAG: dihydroneopterin aldolase [Candidatus Omnitrophica bacterium]|nr:dihydroneopterin aldolase [Candidatus Omnitrophota bacterium]
MADKIFLQSLEVRCVIGIFDWERKIRQKVLIDLEIPADIRRAAKSDSIQDTVDYKSISKHMIAFVSKSRFKLIETLAEKLARSIFANFPISEIKLRVSKPGAIRGAENVGVEITRQRK